jgi:hypothetical protein
VHIENDGKFRGIYNKMNHTEGAEQAKYKLCVLAENHLFPLLDQKGGKHDASKILSESCSFVVYLT